MKTSTLLILLMSLGVSQATNMDPVNRVKAKFLVNYKNMCIQGGDKNELAEDKLEIKCACQVKQFDENLSGDEVIRLFTSRNQFQYPELKSNANALIKKCHTLNQSTG